MGNVLKMSVKEWIFAYVTLVKSYYHTPADPPL